MCDVPTVKVVQLFHFVQSTWASPTYSPHGIAAYSAARHEPRLLQHVVPLIPPACSLGPLHRPLYHDGIHCASLKECNNRFPYRIQCNSSSNRSPYRIQCNSSSNRSPYRIQCNSSFNRSPYRIQCNSSSNRFPYRIQCNSSSNRSPYRIV